MNFQVKYLIRWGIPGWIVLFLLVVLIYVSAPESSVEVLLSNPLQNLGLLVGLSGIGIPIGHLIYQIYFGMEWVTKKYLRINLITDQIEGYKRKHKDDTDEYMYLEYVWQSALCTLDKDQRDYLSQRYSHMLSTKHSLGALIIGISIGGILSIFIVKSLGLTVNALYYILGAEIMFLLLLLLNYRYYSDITMKFQGYFINQIINEKKIKFSDSEILEK